MPALQPYCSHSESLRSQISNACWQQGRDVFFTQSIPFSVRNNLVFAQQLVDLFISVLTQAPEPPYHVYEFGSGLGILGRFFLDILRESYPDIYAQTTLWMTDVSDTMLDILASVSFLAPHLEHLQFETLSVTSFTLPHPALLCYGVYVLDALPARMVKLDGGQLYEIMVQTDIAPDAHVLDTSVYPPRRLSHPEIEDLLLTPESPRAVLLGPQLIRVLEETYCEVPIKDLSHWTAEEKSDLSEFLEPHSSTFPWRFNYASQIRGHLTAAIQNLHPNGAYVVSDFGFSAPVETDISRLTSRHGTTQFSTVCFPYMTYCATKLGGMSLQTFRSERATQEWVLFPPRSQLQELPFPRENDRCVELVFDALTEISSLVPDASDYPTKVQTIFNALPENTQQDYMLLKKIMMALFEHHYPQSALVFAEKMVEIYQELAISGILLTGIISHQQGDEETASLCFQSVMAICPTLAAAYTSQATLLLCQKNYEAAFPFLQAALRYSSRLDEIEHLIGLCNFS